MYAYIKGTIQSVLEDSVIVENGGIGYRIFVPGSSRDELSAGDERRFYTHFAVREDAMLLYGFLTQDELELFRMLLGVSGVGPKGALGILGVMRGDDLRFAVLSDDAAAISRAPGVGRKTAQKIILELKDKMDLMEAFESKAEKTAGGVPDGSAGAQSDAIMALTALGYGNTEAMKAVRKAAADAPDAGAEELIRAALRLL
ncbi:MAG: Holliday junction branch migration protein RuvA [Lachnospiraceae bacterium]|nr:Holliday junction branch migration protein RuvA [Lachnospiraceae bacterium]